jgi:hypothetical protein
MPHEQRRIKLSTSWGPSKGDVRLFEQQTRDIEILLGRVPRAFVGSSSFFLLLFAFSH